jgi:diguanylate cyclase (GGDEF)-like protein
MDSSDNRNICSLQNPDCPVQKELATLRARVQKLEEETHRDELTQLFNRRYFNHSINQELERTRRSSLPTSLIFLDIDHFKTINDKHGHPAGDIALQYIAKAITHALRKLDIACRYGGDEYAIILPSTAINIAIGVAGRLRKHIIDNPILLPNNQDLTITLSIGVASANDIDDLTAKALTALADSALYKAKNKGRDCIVAHLTQPQTSLDGVF